MKKLFSLLLIFVIYTVPVYAQSPFGDPPQNAQDPGGPNDPGPSTTPDNPTNPGPAGTLTNPLNPGTGLDAGTGINAGVGYNPGTAIDPGTGLPVVGNGLLPVNQNAGTGIGTGSPTDPGWVVYGGDGNKQNFWDYLKDLFSLKGNDNQSTYKNQDTDVLKYTDNTRPDLPKSLSTGQTKSFSCARNTSNKTINGYLNLATCMVLYLIPIVISALVLWFMFGSVRVLSDNKSENRNEYKQFLTWGILIIFVALSFVGIVSLLSKTLGL